MVRNLRGSFALEEVASLDPESICNALENPETGADNIRLVSGYGLARNLNNVSELLLRETFCLAGLLDGNSTHHRHCNLTSYQVSRG